MTAARCFVCDAAMWADTDRGLVFPSGRRRGFRYVCGSCGALVDAPDRRAECRAHLDAALIEGRFASDEAAPYGLDIYTLRTAATRARLLVEPADAEAAASLRDPPGAFAARVRLARAETGGERCVSLGILCRSDDLDRVLRLLPIHRGWIDEVVVMVDADEVPQRETGGVRLAARPLGEDFAEQRNALQDLGTRAWMLQLDADESLDPDGAALLPALARMADRDGAVSVGLPRRNLVDGVMSAVFPDVQYRLNRREVRYAGRVHERPERPWQRSFIALHGAIGHHLDRARVLSRSSRYERIAPGHGRPEEADALLEPYRD